MKVDTIVVQVLLKNKYRLIGCTQCGEMIFAGEADVAVLREDTISFVKDHTRIELDIESLSFNGNQTNVLNLDKKWGWEFGKGRIRNNFWSKQDA